MGNQRYLFGVTLIGLGILVSSPTHAQTIEPRVVLALYDSEDEAELKFSRIHRLAEMPLNHLGLVVEYHDLRQGPPPLSGREDVRGVLTWFSDSATIDPRNYLLWLHGLLDSGRRLVVLGDLGVPGSVDLEPITGELWRKLGIRFGDHWVRLTYDLEILHRDPRYVEFERPYQGILPGYSVVEAVDGTMQSKLTVRRRGLEATRSHAVIVGDKGGYVALGYTHYGPDSDRLQWYINPFSFFETAFGTEALPKPDTTTACGRRLFYSHIDGDGWRNETEIEKYRHERGVSAEVVFREILTRFDDLPVTVAPIAGDLDPAWHGDQASLELAKRVFALPHVEAGSHTYSHPLDWGYFTKGRGTSKPSSVMGWLHILNRLLGRPTIETGVDSTFASSAYEAPRSYAREPFSLELEIEGSVRFVEKLLPEGKKVQVFQWSGNTLPFPEAVEMTRSMGLRNINGGDTRYDSEYPSYGWAAPLGRRAGPFRQVYASSSNENTYTDSWTGRFFGFAYLKETLERTETPIRIKPFNVYYHMYSGQKLAGLEAVLSNLDYARTRPLIPTTTSNYAAIVDGFFTTAVEHLGEREWRIRDRGALQTLRLDHADRWKVDWTRSEGVIGQRHFQGSLYIALDPQVNRPILALSVREASGTSPVATRPYLVESRWHISDVKADSDRVTFRAQGFGSGEMRWWIPWTEASEVVVETPDGGRSRSSVAARGQHVSITLTPSGLEPVRVSISRTGNRG